MIVLDGRNPHEVPKIIEITPNYVKRYRLDGEEINCLSIEGKFVPCASASHSYEKYDFVLCATYKTFHGFKKWLKRYYPLAEAIS